jgi:hypothetical protein
VKFKVIAAIAMATAAATTALSLGMAGSALAAPLKSKPAPQVTGTRLQSALLPVSAFGDGFSLLGHLNTGSSLWSTRAFLKVSRLSCANFETYIYVGGFGDTAGATAGFINPNPAFADFPNVILAGDQAVLQFKTTQAAASFYNQAYAKYNQCSGFTESDPDFSFELTNQSLSATTIDNNKAFQLIQYVDLSSMPALNFYQNTAVVLDGTNIYVMDDLNGTNDPVSTSLLGELINHVQALYKR